MRDVQKHCLSHQPSRSRTQPWRWTMSPGNISQIFLIELLVLTLFDILDSSYTPQSPVRQPYLPDHLRVQLTQRESQASKWLTHFRLDELTHIVDWQTRLSHSCRLKDSDFCCASDVATQAALWCALICSQRNKAVNSVSLLFKSIRGQYRDANAQGALPSCSQSGALPIVFCTGVL